MANNVEPNMVSMGDSHEMDFLGELRKGLGSIQARGLKPE